jgi:GAF domain-containing protein
MPTPRPKTRHSKEIGGLLQGLYSSREYSPNFSADDVAAMRANYSGNVTLIDDEIGKIIRVIRQRGELNRTLIVFTSDHGEAALASIDRQLPELVLADIMMPRLGGLELLARCAPIRIRAPYRSSLYRLGLGEQRGRKGSAARLRRETERVLRRNEAWLAGQKFQAAVNGAPLGEALGILVHTAAEQTGSNARCAFHMTNSEGTELRHLVGMSESHARDVEGFKVGPDSLACGLAIEMGEPIFTHDVVDEPRWAPWLWLAKKHDYRACWSFPVETSSGKTVGSFAMYFREPRSPTDEDRKLVAALTHTASIIM